MPNLVRYPGAVVVEMGPRPCFTDDDHERVKELLYQAGRQEPRLVIDCRAVETISGMFLSALVQTMRRLGARPGDITLCDVPDFLRSMFEITKLDRLFPLAATRDEALANVGPAATPIFVDRS
jgi:anti-anti-sigma factor